MIQSASVSFLPHGDGKGGEKRLLALLIFFLSEDTGVSSSFPPVREASLPPDLSLPGFYLLLFSSASSQMLQLFLQTVKRRHRFQSNQQSLCCDAVLLGLST